MDRRELDVMGKLEALKACGPFTDSWLVEGLVLSLEPYRWGAEVDSRVGDVSCFVSSSSPRVQGRP